MDEANIRQKITEAGLRITYPRLALLAELQRSSSPKSAAELSATLSQFPRSSIYRNLETLETASLLKSSMIKWVRRYELGDLLVPHHHHLTCTVCGNVIQFDSPKLEKQLISSAGDNGYKLISHVVELRGICSNCSSETSATSMIAQGINTMKRFRTPDPIMEQLQAEDHYNTFPTDDKPTEDASQPESPK